ncbi:type IV secretory pathway VirD4 protein family protein [Bifidobacterium saguini DSM 23967]|uniref:Type IV secretory pathway VirD4 protein family protein n=1 Tax=Bifidobacterium saguini DSM 23967 TaxID=1437607 RepID=A0A087D6X6_9BIFI|nr:TraM recognition domain-containing protein [Bifidobacterium saguini]KFI91276.1 type IV secretory pathway VirD4 protein family protein [Bifidobacterium saguini DSM 23967]
MTVHVDGGSDWYDRLRPDSGGSAPLYGSEEIRSDSRRRVMAWWRGWEDSAAGSWIAEHTGLLGALSRENSRLVRHAVVGLVLFGLFGLLVVYMLVGGDFPIAFLLSMPLLVAVFSVSMLLWVFWDAYRDSSERLVDRLSVRPGMATRRQVAERLGTRAVLRTVVPAVLPGMLERARIEAGRRGGSPVWPHAWQAAMPVGYSHRIAVWLSDEMHVYVLGPARSGKTVCVVIPAVVEAPGFCLVTSTRSDVVSATRTLRENGVEDASTGARYGGGRVHVFDPEGLGGSDPATRHNMHWTPLMGCDDPTTAMRRAQTLVGVGGLGQGSNNREWGVSAGGYIQALLYAAAISNLPVSKCYEWSLSPQNAREAADLIRMHTPAGDSILQWADTLQGLEHMDARQLSSEWFGVRNAFAILADPKVRRCMNLPPHDPGLIDPKRMVMDGDTVYVLSRPKSQAGGGVNAGLFAALLLDTFQEACQDLALSSAAKGSGGNLRKIEPPARFVLDELSNIETWGGLRNAVTQGGGNGYQLVMVEQDRNQMIRDYDRETEATIWSNCNRIMLGGVTDRDSLEWWGMQVGRHETTRREYSWNPGQGPLGGFSERTQSEESVLPYELSQLPHGWMIVQPVRMPPVLVHAVHFMDRGWWKDKEER